ncbi:hypothetical protein METBIDRAFT_11451 [Metschnikowia bicuspidata var. bicuspidata NRRL YB-4993]|uniref:Hyphally-regulated cell wall protein N-terminal domain-containing protein n=1 Tax=Metschnikowia bicuspidata var. bicuspidata NRRL YB-4993 TaxID=869754 RepID=A0A1A0HFJ9_9ASCO|nr:hypothetical protein METBIDRAFT_11451 [Metschnikowia bicuspidata var. bicuspidata NRRL YB-4993]OBA22638.1 hypothetical protein METBIDRAFT_11451 [Metschnikowia bicuspidata var. bicuspidata NRRL YB-4993]
MRLDINAVAVAISFMANLVFALNITQNTVEIATGNLNISDIIIPSGLYLSVLNSPMISLLGIVQNSGELFVTSTENLLTSVKMTGVTFDNHDTAVFRSSSNTYRSYFRLQLKNYFLNRGKMLFSVPKAQMGGVEYSIISEISWTNLGTIVFECLSDTMAYLIIYRTVDSAESSSVLNDGSICLLNTMWDSMTKVNGDGCINVGTGSELRLLTNFLASSSPQTIYLLASDSKLKVSGSLSRTDIPELRVEGFGGGNQITFYIPEVDIDYFYSPKEGSVSIKVSRDLKLVFHIGKGYDSTKFSWNVDGMGGHLSYSDTLSREIPKECRCDAAFPEAPTTVLPSPSSSAYSSYSWNNVSTSTFSNTGTSSGSAIITSNASESAA